VVSIVFMEDVDLKAGYHLGRERKRLWLLHTAVGKVLVKTC
jgi:hypothetical protein